MTISDKLQELLDIKQDIKTAIKTKGVPMTNVAFTEYAGKIDEISLPKEEQTKTVTEPNFSSGNVIVAPDAGKVLTQVTVVKDNDLVPENIVKDVNIFGVVGTAETGGGGMTYEDYARTIYLTWGKSNQFATAWEHSLTVNPSEISRVSPWQTPRGKAQYPNGETEGVIIPQGITSIGDNAFRDWSSNNQLLVIPNSVTSISDSAFYNWSSNNQSLVIPNSVTSIGNRAFQSWSSNNQSLVIPDSVTIIGDSAFQSWNTNTQPLVIPNSVTSIGQQAFQNWSSNNQPLVIPNSVTSIGNRAFQSWTSNNQPLVISNSVTIIVDYAFSECSHAVAN